jgi:hypothetical protein
VSRDNGRNGHGVKSFATVFGLAALAAVAASCSPATSGPRALALMPGVINRTDNKSLRTAMLKYGLEQFCQEMTHRGAPLKLSDDAPTIGRFFAQRCDTRFFDDETHKSFLVQFFGYGYAWTNTTQRFGFESAGVVEYDPDFLLDGSTMYVYFRTKHIGASSFQTTMVEGALANAALALAPQGMANQIGQQIVSAEMTRGFTVIRDGDGSVDFGLGIVDKGKHPFHPFQVKGGDKVLLANERTEVHSNQREFLGPFLVDGDGRALYLTMSIDGIDAVDVMVFPKDAADPWLAQYAHQPQATPPPYPPLMQDVVTSRMEWKKALPVAKGYYYVVVDNTATAGRVAPPAALMDDRAALVNYVVQVGDQ